MWQQNQWTQKALKDIKGPEDGLSKCFIQLSTTLGIYTRYEKNKSSPVKDFVPFFS